MAAQLITSETSVDDSRYERIDGQLIERPVPLSPHACAQTVAGDLLREALRGSKGRAWSEWSMARPDHADRTDPDYMTPDILVAYPPLIRARNDGHLAVPGFLAVEVLSPNQDLIWKALLYESWGTPHVWIINPEQRMAYEYHGHGSFTIRRDELRAGDLKISLAPIWDELDRLAEDERETS